MAATAAESIAAIREVKALSLEDAFAEDFGSRNVQSQHEELKAARLSAKLGRTVDGLAAVATALTLWYGAVLTLRGAMTPGDLLVFLTYLKRAVKPAKDFAKYTGRLAKATAAGERVADLLAQRPDVRDLPGAAPAPALAGAVRFEAADFAYEKNKTILTDVSFETAPGSFVVLTGPSGSGKSTLVSLLMRLHEPNQGRVMIDGRDVRDYTLASLRPQVSVVLQEAILFATTVSDNIGFGVPDATPEQIEAAARTANAHDFIMELPEGYDTVIGERGATLSQGQRQRISIARAAMRRTPILILDEPTNGLDEENEREVTAALKRLARGRTTFLITHDLKLTALADEILYLDNGRLVERGAPAELIRSGGSFSAMYRMQAEWAPSHES